MPYMLGTTAGRAALGLYFFGCPRNVLDVQPRAWMAPLAGLMFAQVALVGAQLELVKAVKAAGKPTIVVLVSGKPVAEPWIQARECSCWHSRSTV